MYHKHQWIIALIVKLFFKETLMKLFVIPIIILLNSFPAWSDNYDLSCDGVVDFDDFFLFMDDFGRTSDSSLSCSAILSDFDCNHAVDINDFFLFADNYGKTVEVTADCGQVLNTDKNNANASTFYGPASLAEALERVREISWNSLPTDPSDLSTVILGISTTSDVLTVKENGTGNPEGLSFNEGMLANSKLSNDQLLLSTFKLIEFGIDTYRLVSIKHSNFCIDYVNKENVPTLTLKDYRSHFRDPDTAAFLTFSFEQNEGGIKLIAQDRHVFSESTENFVMDGSWNSAEVRLRDNELILANEEDATSLTFNLFTPPISTQIPTDYNPLATQRVDNDEIPLDWDGKNSLDNTIKDLNSEYSDQVATAGINSNTRSAAESMLNQISETIQSEGLQLRYPIEFYLAVRENMLAKSVQVSDVYNTEIGVLAVPYVFFTNETGDDGLHHPFMIIASRGTGEGITQLWDVPRPPGEGTPGTQYPDQRVTRNAYEASIFAKIPMRDYGLVSSVSENDMVGDLAGDAGVTDLDQLNYVSLSGNGIAIDGIIVYPAMNNTLTLSAAVGEISSLGMHSGRGLDLHYHSDAYSANPNGLNFYNKEDYLDRTHPPIISFSFDGIAGYGFYQTGDNSSQGVDLDLDAWGGHDHDIYNYHYHSQPIGSTASGKGKGPVDFTAHMLPPKGAWRGRINDIPDFWSGNKPSYKGRPGTYQGF